MPFRTTRIPFTLIRDPFTYKKFSEIPTDVKMPKTKVDTLHNAFVSQADVNTISEGLRKSTKISKIWKFSLEALLVLKNFKIKFFKIFGIEKIVEMIICILNFLFPSFGQFTVDKCINSITAHCDTCEGPWDPWTRTDWLIGPRIPFTRWIYRERKSKCFWSWIYSGVLRWICI